MNTRHQRIILQHDVPLVLRGLVLLGLLCAVLYCIEYDLYYFLSSSRPLYTSLLDREYVRHHTVRDSFTCSSCSTTALAGGQVLHTCLSCVQSVVLPPSPDPYASIPSIPPLLYSFASDYLRFNSTLFSHYGHDDTDAGRFEQLFTRILARLLDTRYPIFRDLCLVAAILCTLGLIIGCVVYMCVRIRECHAQEDGVKALQSATASEFVQSTVTPQQEPPVDHHPALYEQQMEPMHWMATGMRQR